MRASIASAMWLVIVFPAKRWIDASSGARTSPAPMADAASIARTREAVPGASGRSTSMFGPTGGSDQVRGEMSVPSGENTSRA